MIARPVITCVDCGGRASPHAAARTALWYPGDIVAYRCEDCLDRWDIVLPDDDDDEPADGDDPIPDRSSGWYHITIASGFGARSSKPTRTWMEGLSALGEEGFVVVGEEQVELVGQNRVSARAGSASTISKAASRASSTSSRSRRNDASLRSLRPFCACRHQRALAAQLEVDLGQLEAVGRRDQRLDAGARRASGSSLGA